MKRIILTIIVIILVLIGIWLWNSRTTQEEASSGQSLPQFPEVSDQDTTVQIQQDLDQINVGDIEEQFQNIDAELNNL